MMKEIASARAKDGERYSGVYSKFPIGMVDDATLAMLDFEPYEVSFTMPDVSHPERYWKVYSPVTPRSREVTVVEVPIKLFGKIFWQPYIGEVEKPVFIETEGQQRQYLESIRGLVQPENRVEPGALDSKLKEYASKQG